MQMRNSEESSKNSQTHLSFLFSPPCRKMRGRESNRKVGTAREGPAWIFHVRNQASETFGGGGLGGWEGWGVTLFSLPSFSLLVSPWESRCEDCVCPSGHDTLVQYAAYLIPSLSLFGGFWGMVSFDSDYSGGDDASPLFFLRYVCRLYHLLYLCW